MQQFARHIAEALTSEQGLQQLNVFLPQQIPFNKAHGLSVQHLSRERVEVYLPYQEPNFNHVEGLHACALATAAELATGLLVLVHLDPSQYRLLMKSMHIAFHRQAKQAALATSTLDPERLHGEVLPTLGDSGGVIPLEVRINDLNDHLLCSAQVDWHVKRWNRVRLRPES